MQLVKRRFVVYIEFRTVDEDHKPGASEMRSCFWKYLRPSPVRCMRWNCEDGVPAGGSRV
jgi:hypothetical protein